MKISIFSAYFANSLIDQIVSHYNYSDVEIFLWALESTNPKVAKETIGHGKFEKWIVFNKMLANHPKDFDYIGFVDDDAIPTKENFLPSFVWMMNKYNLDIAQPAQTVDSKVGHSIVVQQKNCKLRITNFVENGPCVFMTKKFFDYAYPFDENNGMGWGFESQWTKIAQTHKMNQGIIDALPVRHNFRALFSKYNKFSASAKMQGFLKRNKLRWSTGHTIEYIR